MIKLTAHIVVRLHVQKERRTTLVSPSIASSLSLTIPVSLSRVTSYFFHLERARHSFLSHSHAHKQEEDTQEDTQEEQ